MGKEQNVKEEKEKRERVKEKTSTRLRLSPVREFMRKMLCIVLATGTGSNFERAMPDAFLSGDPFCRFATERSYT